MQMHEKWCRGDRRLSDNKWDASCLCGPLQRATVGNGTKIWGANLKPDTFQCLIFLLLHITIRRLQICVLHSPHWGINQYFHTYYIWRAAGLNLRYENRPPFSIHAVVKNVFALKAKGHKDDSECQQQPTWSSYSFSYTGLKRHNKIKQQFGKQK